MGLPADCDRCAFPRARMGGSRGSEVELQELRRLHQLRRSGRSTQEPVRIIRGQEDVLRARAVELKYAQPSVRFCSIRNYDPTSHYKNLGTLKNTVHGDQGTRGGKTRASKTRSVASKFKIRRKREAL
jgi:hypothetical protein